MYHTFPTGESDMEFTLRPNVDNPSTLSNMGANDNGPLSSEDVIDNIRGMITVPVTSNTIPVSSMVSPSAGMLGGVGMAGTAGNAGWAGFYGVAGPTRVVGTNNSTLDNSWVVYDGTGTVTFNRAEWPVDGIYHNFSNFYACGVKEIMEIMFLVCKCIKHGISPQILIDIGDDLNANNNPQSIIEQLKSFLKEQDYGMDDLEEDIMKDLQMNKNEV